MSQDDKNIVIKQEVIEDPRWSHTSTYIKVEKMDEEPEPSTSVVKIAEKHERTSRSASPKEKLLSHLPEITEIICRICKAEFKTKGSMTTHIKMMHERDVSEYRCEPCNVGFKWQSSLRGHNAKVHRKTSSYFECEKCSKQFKTKDSKNKHLKRVHLKDLIECKGCEASFKSILNLRRHVKKVHDNLYTSKTYKCDMCDVSLDSKTYFFKHIMVKHTDSKIFRCPLCKLKFESAEGMVEHYTDCNQQNETEDVSCPMCKATYKSKSRLRVHILSKHNPNVVRFQCNYCKKKYLNKSNLIVHIEKHMEAKKSTIFVKCNVCSKDFKTKKTLSAHKRQVHFVKKLLQCNLCPTTFKRPATLKEHILALHSSNQELYRCDICDATFRWKRSIYGHKQHAHANAKTSKQYNCNECPAEFPIIAKLKLHVKTVHRMKRTVYTCDYCGLKFNLKDSIRSHIQIKHMYSGLKCTICKEILPNKKELIAHRLNIHQIEPKIKSKPSCNDCNQTFKNDQLLQKHLKIYHETTISCEICEENFDENLSLAKHMRVLHKKFVRLYKCHECNDGFTKAGKLRMHIKHIHGQEIPKVSCNKCDKSFLYSESLKRHDKKVHAIIKDFENALKDNKTQNFTHGEIIVKTEPYEVSIKTEIETDSDNDI